MQKRRMQEMGSTAEQRADIFRYAWLAIDLVGGGCRTSPWPDTLISLSI
jgi:hypothetical protein